MKKLTKLFLTLCIVGLFTFIASCGGKVTPKTYKVVFETKGGSIVKSVNVEENTELTFPADPTKDGFEFAGWYLDENYTEKVTVPYVVTKDIIFYANWKVLETTEILVNVVEQRASFELFEDNRSVKTNKRTEFFDLTKQYLVGDDNPWKVKPSVSFVKRNKVTGDIESKHILIEVKTTDSMTEDEKRTTKEDALKKAKEAITKLNEGKTFEEVSKEYSDDDATKNNGGSMGFVNTLDLDDVTRQELTKLEVGKYSTEPLETEYGYEIFLKVSVKDKPKLEEVKTHIIETLTDEKLTKDSKLQYKAMEYIRDKYEFNIKDEDLEIYYENTMNNLLNSSNE